MKTETTQAILDVIEALERLGGPTPITQAKKLRIALAGEGLVVTTEDGPWRLMVVNINGGAK